VNVYLGKTVRRDAAFAKAIDKIVAEYGDAGVKRNLLGADVPKPKSHTCESHLDDASQNSHE
jgi:hypothetical protein